MEGHAERYHLSTPMSAGCFHFLASSLRYASASNTLKRHRIASLSKSCSSGSNDLDHICRILDLGLASVHVAAAL